jgi:antitoxin component YwqK of YwqJK toxin-antitoxin module
MTTSKLSLALCCTLFLQGYGEDNFSHASFSEEAVFPANLRTYVARQDTDNDGKVDSVHSFRATYDESGRVTESTWECDHDFDGETDNRELLFYNDDGKIEQKYVFFDGDGDMRIDSARTEKYSYDSDGRLLEEIVNTDYGENGVIDHTIVFTYAYDHDGNLIEKTMEKSRRGASSGYVESTDHSFSADGKIANYIVTKNDPRADDGITTYSFTYDSAGNVEKKVVSIDSDNDGRPDRVTTTRYTYREAALLKSAITEFDYDGDGIADIRYTDDITCDAANRPIRIEGRAVDVAGEAVVWSGTQVITYAADGKGCETSVAIDEDGDGNGDSTAVFVMEFAETGMTGQNFPVEIGPRIAVTYPLVAAITMEEVPF